MVILEPHGDDALLSASSWLPYCTTVYTIFNDRSSERLREFFPHLSVVNLSIDCKQGLQYADRPSSAVISGNFSLSGEFWESYKNYVAQENKLVIQEILNRLGNSLKSDTVITTLGLVHPQHITARIVAECAGREVYYASEPAVRFRRLGQLAERMALANSRIDLNWTQPVLENKLEIFKRCYPTESFLIRDKSLESDMLMKEEFWRKVNEHNN